LAEHNSIEVDTSPLRSALHVLLQTSTRLDAIRAELETNLNQSAELHGKSTVIQTFKEWVGFKLGLAKPWSLHDGSLHHLDRHTKRELEAYLLAPEHAPAMDIQQSPINIYGTSSFFFFARVECSSTLAAAAHK